MTIALFALALTSLPLSPEMSAVLDEHNRARAAVGVRPLVWDYALERDAEAWARHLARTGQFVHAPRAGRGAARENLSLGGPGWSSRALVGNWLRERRWFKPGVYPDVATTGRWDHVAHYTQMIWPSTTRLGCAIADGRGRRILVCRYLPGGNRDGVRVPR